MEADQNTSKEYGAKLLYGFLTLVLLWSAANSQPELLWPRQILSFVLVLVGVALWARITSPEAFRFIFEKPKREEIIKSFSWATASSLLGAAIAALMVFALPESPWISWEFLKTANVYPYFWALPFVVLTSYFVEFFMRGYLSKSWGRGNVAFLESITIAVALQHILPFVLLLPLFFMLDKITKTRGLRVAALTRALWTLAMCLIIGLLAL
jgi:hypothetical protein